jgi:hypothetical protein
MHNSLDHFYRDEVCPYFYWHLLIFSTLDAVASQFQL